jgi:hypothetical protein
LTPHQPSRPRTTRLPVFSSAAPAVSVYAAILPAADSPPGSLPCSLVYLPTHGLAIDCSPAWIDRSPPAESRTRFLHRSALYCRTIYGLLSLATALGDSLPARRRTHSLGAATFITCPLALPQAAHTLPRANGRKQGRRHSAQQYSPARCSPASTCTKRINCTASDSTFVRRGARGTKNSLDSPAWWSFAPHHDNRSFANHPHLTTMGNGQGKPIDFDGDGKATPPFSLCTSLSLTPLGNSVAMRMQDGASFPTCLAHGHHPPRSTTESKTPQSRLTLASSEPQSFPPTSGCRPRCLRQGANSRAQGHRAVLCSEVHPKG